MESTTNHQVSMLWKLWNSAIFQKPRAVLRFLRMGHFLLLLLRPIRRHFERSHWKALDLKWTLHSGLKIKIQCDAEWVLYNDIFVDSEYDLAIRRSLESIHGDRTFRVLDLGGNVGFFVIRLCDFLIRQHPLLHYEITVIEGSPKVYAELLSRLSIEPALSGKVRTYHGLAGKREGVGKMVESPFHALSEVGSANIGNGVTVPYIDLCTLFEKETEIDLLKCDIEGSEMDFISHYHHDLLAKTRVAVFEFHHGKCDMGQCLSILKDIGFKNHLLSKDTDHFSVHAFWR